MLISLEQVIVKYQMKIKGIIHVGAHYGQEYEAYVNNGVTNIVFIEPCTPAFKVLQSRVGNSENVITFQCACGEANGHAEMYVETKNNGQSNSLLKARTHLIRYPEIQFNDRETVAVRRLDELPLNIANYNLLMMDTQGGELNVLKGATQTLMGIDYIYTEVNNQELYEGNAMVHEIDAFLDDQFHRVETYWVGDHGWGDAIYIRKTGIKI